jgi:hypothetical protein
MKYRKLRIALSVVFSVLCLLLIALWVRSYWRHDALWHTSTSNAVHGVASSSGTILFQQIHATPGVTAPGWHYTYYPKPHAYLGFTWERKPAYTLVGAPMWFLAASLLVAGAAPWLRWRFSLRTLLIGITVVAAVLGLVIWAGT